MRRTLVQGDDSAHHPFLLQLPRHVRHGGGLDPVQRRYQRLRRDIERPGLRTVLNRWLAASRINTQDVRDFLLAYCAGFVAISVFLA